MPDSEKAGEEEDVTGKGNVKKNDRQEKIHDRKVHALEKPGALSQANKKAKCRRIKGEAYFGYKRVEGKVSFNIPRGNRRFKDRTCTHKGYYLRKWKNLFMFLLVKKQRQNVFNYFWKELSTRNEKKSLVKGLVATREIRRRKCSSQKKLKN